MQTHALFKTIVLLKAFFFLGLGVVNASLSPTNFQAHATIQEAAEDHVLNLGLGHPRIPEVIAERLDSRLKLPICEQPLTTFSPIDRQQTSRITVGVRCEGERPWTLYVPVSVKVMAPVVVTKRPLLRGQAITTADLGLELRNIMRLHQGYLETIDEAVGKEVRIGFRQGQVIIPSRLLLPHLIKKNSQIVILANSDSIEVRMAGKALENGGKGEKIRVQNSHSKRQVEGWIIAPGIVKVAM